MSSLQPGAGPDSAKEAIRIGDRARDWREQTRWGFLLVIFMRIVAALWLFQGVYRWSEILTPAVSIFDGENAPRAGIIVFFAVMDLLAAIGLWLATPWGGVLWLVAVATEAFSAVALQGSLAAPRVTLAVDVVLVIAYFVLTWYAAREREAL
jgi:hypothetical protein